MVLNGEIDLETARLYTAAARTIVQALGLEVSRARFLATEPVLDLTDDEYGRG